MKDCLAKYPQPVAAMFTRLRQLLLSSVSREITETVWAGMPSFYVDERFVRLIPFKDHINIEAKAAAQYRDALLGYKFTPKGMLQIFVSQEIPEEILTKIFAETLESL